MSETNESGGRREGAGSGLRAAAKSRSMMDKMILRPRTCVRADLRRWSSPKGSPEGCSRHSDDLQRVSGRAVSSRAGQIQAGDARGTPYHQREQENANEKDRGVVHDQVFDLRDLGANRPAKAIGKDCVGTEIMWHTLAGMGGGWWVRSGCRMVACAGIKKQLRSSAASAGRGSPPLWRVHAQGRGWRSVRARSLGRAVAPLAVCAQRACELAPYKSMVAKTVAAASIDIAK